MNGLIGAVALLLVVVQYGSFNPDPLNDLTINFNVKDSPRAFADKGFEDDNDERYPVVIGGVTNNREPLQDLEVFDGEWIPYPPGLDHYIYNTAAITYENRIYLIGGMYKGKNGQDQIFPLFIERDDDGEWETVNELKNKRKQHSATVHSTTDGPGVFMTGGDLTDGVVSTSMEVCLLGPLGPNEKREWVTKPVFDMKKPRSEHAQVFYHGELYVIGGRSLDSNIARGLRSIEIYRAKSGNYKWSLKAGAPYIMKEKRMGHGAEVVEDDIVVCGGRYREKSNTEMIYLRSCETFNGAKWDDTKIGDMNHARSNFGLMFNGGKLWAFGGFNKDEVLSSVEFLTKDGQSNKSIWKLENTKNFLRKPRANFGVAKYSIPATPSKKRLLEQENIVNSTFV